MKVAELIQQLLSYKDLDMDVVIVDEGETLVTKEIDVCIMPDLLIDNPEDKYISAITHDGDNVVGEVVYLISRGFYMEPDYWKDIHNAQSEKRSEL